MNPATALAATLTLLTDALDDPAADLTGELALLTQQARSAVSSFLGVTITVALRSDTVAITAPPAPWTDTPRTSMHYTAAPATAAAHGAEEAAVAITFYASTLGAFIDLGADLAYLLGLPLTEVVLDRHLPAHTGAKAGSALSDPITVQDLSLINQAIGILIDQGHHPDDARHTLTRNALTAGTTLAAAAALILPR